MFKKDSKKINIERLQVIKLQPKDVIIISVPFVLSDDQKDRLRLDFRDKLSIANKIVILDGNMKLEMVLRGQ